MNKKLTVIHQSGETVWCVLDGERPEEEELNRVMGFTPGGGYAATLTARGLCIVDYFPVFRGVDPQGARKRMDYYFDSYPGRNIILYSGNTESGTGN